MTSGTMPDRPLLHPSDIPFPELGPHHLADPCLWHPPEVSVLPGARSYLGLTYARPIGWRALLMDLHLPLEPRGPVPVVAYAHGGSMLGGDRAMGPWAALPSQGIAVATLEYRLAGEVRYPEAIEDVRAGLGWLTAHAEDYDLDPDRLVGWGSSAGAFLMARACLSPEQPIGRPVGRSHDYRASALVLHYPPVDFAVLLEDAFEATPEADASTVDVVSQLFGYPMSDDLETISRASLLQAVRTAATVPPTWISHGDADHRVGVTQSRRLEAALHARGLRAVLDVVPGADHADEVFASPEVIDPTIAFLRETWASLDTQSPTAQRSDLGVLDQSSPEAEEERQMAYTTKKPAPGQTVGAVPGPEFDPADYAEELARVQDNRQVGTALWFENESVQIWDLSLEPGQRVGFHTHDQTYFWTVTDPGRLLQRFDDGTSRIAEASLGQTNFMEYGPDDTTVHDLENVGETFFRCLTVVLKQ
ncbi:MAG TPA: alpha/beta hydrolase fold domain-containing protein [Euzebya sp.]|nr:alpha/beta hydrolase fold domain-containing protein [Euzebya sp.]